MSMKGRRKEKDSPTPVQDEYQEYLEDDYVREKITDTDLNKLVTPPAELDHNEWLASHTISFFEHVNLMYGAVSEFCTTTGCTSMTAPSNTQYLWFDEKGKKCKCAAPQYVDYVMSFTQKTIQDESVFPTKYGNVFPSSFESLVKKIHRYLFHVIAHIYQSHFKEIVLLQLHGHLNTLFQHFMTFSRKYNLLEDKDCEVLDNLFEKLEGVTSVPWTPPPSSAEEGGEETRQTIGESLSSAEENKENLANHQDLEVQPILDQKDLPQGNHTMHELDLPKTS